MGKLPAILALAFAVAIGGSSHAHAAASVPEVDLRVGHDRQRGVLVWEEWTQRSGPGCVSQSADGTGRYPGALPVPPGEGAARFLFRTPLKPKRVSIASYSENPEEVVSPSEELGSVLKARRDEAGTIVAWRAVFSIAPPPDHYLDLYAKWPAGRCGPPRHLYRRFHVAANPARPASAPA